MLQQFTEAEEFDFLDDVVGDDLVVEGVVYDAQVWMPDGEGGVMRRDEVEYERDDRSLDEEGDLDEDLDALLHPNPWDPAT